MITLGDVGWVKPHSGYPREKGWGADKVWSLCVTRWVFGSQSQAFGRLSSKPFCLFFLQPSHRQRLLIPQPSHLWTVCCFPGHCTEVMLALPRAAPSAAIQRNLICVSLLCVLSHSHDRGTDTRAIGKCYMTAQAWPSGCVLELVHQQAVLEPPFARCATHLPFSSFHSFREFGLRAALYLSRSG